MTTTTGMAGAEARTGSQLLDYSFMGMVLKHWRRLLLLGMLGAVIAVAASLLVQKTYRVSVLVTMAEGDKMRLPSGLSGGGLGDLAALAGLAPPGGEDRSEAMAILQSDAFLGHFINSHELAPVLHWRRWDPATGDWKGGLFGKRPTLRASIREFRKHALTLNEDRKTGLVKVELVWGDKENAAALCNALVEDLNETMRRRRIRDAETRIVALQEQLALNATMEVRAALFSLLQQDLKMVTLAKTRKDFALMVLDPAQDPDEYDRAAPLRFIWLFVGGALGVVLGGMMIFFRDLLAAQRQRHE